MSEGDSPLPRIKSLDSTSVSEPIEKQETYRVVNPREVERFLHKKLIEKNILKSRSDKFTEWFAGNFEEIKKIRKLFHIPHLGHQSVLSVFFPPRMWVQNI